MKFEELIVLLPCHSLEDFPTHYEGAAAEGLLAAWSALWHPALLAAANRVPTWFRADGPPDVLANRLILVPEASESLLRADWPELAVAGGACVVRNITRREDMVAAALAALDPPEPTIADAKVAEGKIAEDKAAEDLAADFLALGYCYLAVELLTRQMRYMSNVDEVQLQNEVLAGAKAYLAGDEAATRTHLTNCFEVLREARDRFYPVDCYLIDLTLVAASTLGPRLRHELAGDVPQNFLITGELLAKIAAQEPATLEALHLAVDHGRACLVGGPWRESELPLLPIEAVLADFQRGARTFRELLGQPPTVFGRRRFGLSPVLPQILSRLGYLGALHFTLDDGRFPTSPQCKTGWEGLGSIAIDTLGRPPLDANAPGSFLALSRLLGESMDRDHVATVVLAHWPGQASHYYDDLRRIASYAPVLGKFMTLSDYFSNTTRPGELTRFKNEKYRSPYLRQTVDRQEPDGISRFIDAHVRQANEYAGQTLEALVELLGGKRSNPKEPDPSEDRNCGKVAPSQPIEAAQRLAALLTKPQAGDTAPTGYLLVNPHSFARRVAVDVSALARLPDCEGPVLSVQESGGHKAAVVDVPGMAFAWIGSGSRSTPKPKKPPRPLAAGNVLENEHMKVSLNSESGAIQSIHDNVQRYNRLSAQLALRQPGPKPRPGDVWRDPDETATYSVMAADGIEVTQAGPSLGEIVSRGRLLDQQGQRLAGFTQRFRLVRGSRVLEWDVELDIERSPQGDPWESYYAARLAWRDDFAELWHDVGMTSQQSEARRIEAPHFVELRTDKIRTAILVGGSCFHRRSGERMLDSLLVVQGETRRYFRLGISVDALHPIQAALDLLGGVVVAPNSPRPAGTSASNWLFHVDAKHVVATHWEPLRVDDRVLGFRARLMETAGRGGRVRLRAFRSISTARQVDFQGQTLVELPVDGDCVTIDIAACEWVEVEATW